MRTFMLVLVGLVCRPALTLTAQTPTSLAVGTRVRITQYDTSQARVGTVVELSADTVTLRAEDRTDIWRVPLVSVSRLEMSQGRKSRFGTGLAIGALAGLATGVVGGLAVCEICSHDSEV